ncbi:MAG: glycosyltransferase family 39 protein [Bacteroidales bacterium]|nr:glycosyltransferase family 39 protein [Bacteroidales bacterium]
MSSRKAIKPIFLLLVISILIRAFLAGWIELGTDEAYYWTFAKYPDWSHFDHPGMVGWMIQLFSLNLMFDSEFFLRLTSIVCMTLGTWIMYCIGKELKDETTGLCAALFYTASIYAFVITGIFILPDAPLNLFWLLAFWMFIRFLRRQSNWSLLLAGLSIGLAILSKYTGIFLWAGFLLYILIFDRKHLKNPFLYLSLLITAACCFPIVFWNLQNDFISFRFHGDRVSLFGKPNFTSFFTELSGEFFYNNPMNFAIGILAVIAAFRKKIPIDKQIQRLTLLTALPMIALFLLFSLNRNTLPHWSAPAFVLLIPLMACWTTSFSQRRRGIILSVSMTFLVLTLTAGVLEIKTGFVSLDQNTEATQIGRNDITLDLYGWEQACNKFSTLRDQAIADGEMTEEAGIIGNNWFPTASIDYYIARPLGMKVKGYGHLEKIHKYQWINEIEGGFNKGEDYWYIADSHYYIDPDEAYAYTNFKEICLADTIPIKRNGKTVRNLFVYECKSLVYGPLTLEQVLENNKEKRESYKHKRPWKNY